MKVKLIISTLILLAITAYADPAPFGLEIGKASVENVKEKYTTKYTGINKFSNGEMYEMDVSELSFDGLESVVLIFGDNKKLRAVLCKLQKEKFNYLFTTMRSKYKLVSSNIPFVGDTSAKFVNGNTEVILNAPHMSFQMEMNYIDTFLMKKFKQQSSNEVQQKKHKETAQL